MKKMTIVALLAMAFMSCESGGSDSERVYLTGSDTFTRVDAAGTLAITDIYQYDGEGEFYTGEDVPVTFDASATDIWTVTADGVTYLADAWFGRVFKCDTISALTITFDGAADGVAYSATDSGSGDSGTFEHLVEAVKIVYKGSGKLEITNYASKVTLVYTVQP